MYKKVLMENQELTIDSVFEVGEMKWLDLSIGLFFSILFIFTLNIDSNQIQSHFKVFFRAASIPFYLAVFFIVKAFLKKPSIQIDKTGFYHGSVLVTNWDNFISAELTQKEITGSITDNFIIIMDYYKTGEDGYFQREIALTNTQNKSEEEVLGAIKFFSENYKK